MGDLAGEFAIRAAWLAMACVGVGVILAGCREVFSMSWKQFLPIVRYGLGGLFLLVCLALCVKGDFLWASIAGIVAVILVGGFRDDVRARLRSERDAVAAAQASALGAGMSGRAGLASGDGAVGPFSEQADSARQDPPKAHTAIPQASKDGMSLEDARAILGLGPDYSEFDIRAAHRRIIMRTHPDMGGSDFLTRKVNLAKDVLLSRHLA